MTAEKVRENRLRRIAERRGYRLIKSRRRDPLAINYGTYTVNDPTINVNFPHCSNVGLDEVEQFFSGPARAPTKPRAKKKKR